MSYLIEDLKKEHNLIIGILNEVKKIGIGSQEAGDKLLSAKKGFLGHLKKEDDNLYPVLKKAAESDEKLKRELTVLKEDLQEISKFALDFFEKYSKGSALSLDFARDFGQLFAKLGARIKKEENILYEAYDRLTR